MTNKMSLENVNAARQAGQDLSNVDLSHLNIRLLDLTGVKAVGANLRGGTKPSVLDEEAAAYRRR